MSLLRSLKAHLPTGLKSRLRPLRRSVKRARRGVVQRVAPARVDRAELVDAFRAIGVRSGDGVFLQSALSPFGEIVGGPATVVAALEEVVGPDGTVAMPAFPVVGSAVDYLSGQPVFDVRETPSRMGAVTEYFRRLPGVERSVHPTHSVTARGVGARELVAGHADAATPFGAGTPFAAMIERDFVQVWFGCGVRAFTLYHAFETLREGGFPLPVFLPEPIAAEVIDADGQRRTVEVLVHDPALARVRIDADPAIERRIAAILAERGATVTVRIGRGEVVAARMGTLMRALEALLAEGVTIYDRPLPAGR